MSERIAHKYIPHEPSWIVCTDWNQTEVEWAKSVSDLLEAGAVTCVTGEEQLLIGSENTPTRPQGTIIVCERALRPVLRWKAYNTHIGRHFKFIPPERVENEYQALKTSQLTLLQVRTSRIRQLA